jgi:dihydroflavonol-4-reductase
VSELRGQRILVTGATGFVGGALARALVNAGADVHALARPKSDRSSLHDVDLAWHEGNVTKPRTLERALAGINCVVHAAGLLGRAGMPPGRYHEINVEGTKNVLRAAFAAGNHIRVLHVSSLGVLGVTTGKPATEDAPLAPRNRYERSKAGAEQIAHEFAARGLSVVIARPGFLYGPGDRHVLPLFQAIARGNFFYIDRGRHLCQPTYIDDAVSGMLSCLNLGASGEIYHFVGPQTVSFRQLAETIAIALQVGPPRLSLPRSIAMACANASEGFAKLVRRRPLLSCSAVDFFGDDRVFSTEKARQHLGYAPEHYLAGGIAETVSWYRQEDWL